MLRFKMKNELNKIKLKILPTLKKSGVKKAGIFGSYALGKQKKSSDIDILIKIPNSLSLTDLINIKIELEDRLNKKVDLIEYCCIHPMLKEKILNEEVRII